MGIINDIIGWMAGEIQKATGEADRREKVSRLKELALIFKEKVSLAITKLNSSILAFNTSIHKLNLFRRTTVKNRLKELFVFLNKFGSCKEIGAYSPEREKIPEHFPDHELYKIEDYIGTIDWSHDEVFLNTFLLSPVGMKMKTRKQNLSMQEHINELILQTEATIKELESKQFYTELEKNICDMYLSNIQFISRTISEKITPELELIEAFFQAEKIKNEVICGRKLENIGDNYNLLGIINTPYDKHYRFVKNAVAFYAISCRIYNTPVLTNLLSNCSTDQDLEILVNERRVLNSHCEQLSNTMVVTRG